MQSVKDAKAIKPKTLPANILNLHITCIYLFYE